MVEQLQCFVSGCNNSAKLIPIGISSEMRVKCHKAWGFNEADMKLPACIDHFFFATHLMSAYGGCLYCPNAINRKGYLKHTNEPCVLTFRCGAMVQVECIRRWKNAGGISHEIKFKVHRRTYEKVGLVGCDEFANKFLDYIICIIPLKRGSMARFWGDEI